MKITGFILLIFVPFVLQAQPDSTQTADSTIDDAIEAELISGFQQKTMVVAPAATPDDQILSYYADHGVNYDSLCSSIDLYREVYGWIGTKYRYAGLSKTGVDCAGFVTNICNKIYATKLSGSAVHHFEKCHEITDRSQLEEGDLVFFKINKPNISHVGLYLGNGKFVHAAVHGGVMINDLGEKYYDKYYFTGGRLKPTQYTSNGK